ncbi:MAG: phosphatase PAP2 family protein [Ilumatobacteraceae bacterium]
MPTTLAVLLTGLVGATVLIALAALRGRSHGHRGELDDPIDPADAEHWLVRRVSTTPRLERTLVRVDRRVAGGVGVAVAFVAVFLAALFVGWVFDSIDSGRGIARWDQSVADWGPEHSTAATATFMKWATNLGGTWLVALVMAIVGVVDWRRRRDATGIWFLLTVGVGVVLINNGLKLWIMRERPPVDHLVGAAGSSFPSGHSSSAAACWMAIAFIVGGWLPRRVRPWLAAGAAAIACLVAASRTLLGVHWVTDVVAGLTVGWTWFFLVAIVFGGRFQRFGEPIEELAAIDSDSPSTEHTMNHVTNGATDG